MLPHPAYQQGKPASCIWGVAVYPSESSPHLPPLGLAFGLGRVSQAVSQGIWSWYRKDRQ